VTRLSADYGDEFAAVIASRDPARAGALLNQVRAAVSAGTASGFEEDMQKLASIAGVPMAKAAPGRAERLAKRVTSTLPPHLQAEAEAAIAAIEAATGRLAKAAAMEEGRRARRGRHCRTAEGVSRAEVYPRNVEMSWRDATLGQAV